MLGCQFGTHKLGGQLAPLGGRFLDNDLAPLRVPSGTFFRNSVRSQLGCFLVGLLKTVLPRERGWKVSSLN